MIYCMKKFFTLIMAYALVMSANAVPSLVKADKSQAADRAARMAAVRAEIASQTHRMPLLSASHKVVAAKQDVSVTSVAMATACYFDGTWEIDLYNADTTLLGYVVYEGGDETHLVAANMEIDTTNVAILINGTDTLEAISGSFTVAYTQKVAGVPYYSIVSEDMNSEEEAMEINAEFPVVFAYDYEKYYYSVLYSEYCGTILDCDYEIELEDAPFELTGETINVVINDLIWLDHVADAGWWQLYGMNADSTVYITLSNYDEVTEAAGTYTLEMMDEDYTLFYIGTSYATLAQVKIKELEFTLTLDNDGNPHITGTLIGKDGVVYILDLGGAPKVVPQSDNQITLAYANGIVSINTTNNDNYFFTVESKEEYDSYQSDLTQASVDDEISGWIATYAYYGYLAYVTYSGNQSFTFVDLFNSAPEAGDYVALAAGMTNEGDMTTAGVYALFTYNVGDAVENVEAEIKAVKRLVNGELMIERNGEMFNVQGIRK